MSSRTRLADLAFIALWFIVYRVVSWNLGVRPDSTAPEWLWQVLPLNDLYTDPVEALWYLHAQPPLFNLVIAILLQCPGELWVWLRFTWIAVGLGLPLILFEWFRVAGIPRWLSHTCVLVFALNPTLVLYENFLFYAYPEALCVMGALYGLALQPSRPVLYAAFASLLVALRALFQPVWSLLIAIAACWSLGKPLRATARPWLLAPLAIGLVLVLKNGILFGVWTTSSWYGSNLARLPRMALEESALELQKRAVVSRAFVVGPFQTISAYPPELANPITQQARDRFGPRNVLMREWKDGRHANYNHVGHVAISQQLARDAFAAFKAQPSPVLGLAAEGIRRFLTPASEYAFLEDNRRLLAVPERIFSAVVFPFGTPWLMFLAIGTCVGSALAVLVWPSAATERLRLPAAYTCVTVLWVSCVGNLVEFGENNRYRFAIDALVYAWLVVILWNQVVSRRRWLVAWASRLAHANIEERRAPELLTTRAAFAVLAVGVAAAGAWRFPSPGHEMVPQLERELSRLSVHLPSSGVVGYLDPADNAGDAASVRLFYVTQYALAPRVIVRSVEPAFVIVPRDHALQPDPRLAGLFPYGLTLSGHRVFRRLAR